MKKIIMIILVIVLLFSCGNNESTDISVKEKVTNVYKPIPLELPDNVIIKSSIVIESEIYVLCTDETKNIIYKLDLNGKILDSTLIYNDEEGNISKYARFNDGRYIVLYQYYGIDNITYTLRIFSEIDELLSEIDVLSKATQDISNVYLSYLTTDENNNIYLAGNSYFIVLSENGDRIFDYTLGMQQDINHFGKMPDNRVYINYTDYFSNNVKKIEIIDIAGKTLIPFSLPEKYSSNNYSIFIGPEYDLYIKDSEGLYGYKNSTGESILLANWMNSNITEIYINNIIIISPDCFVFSGYDLVLQKHQLNIMNRIPDDELKEKYIIKMNSFGDHLNLLKIAAAQFNFENEYYQVEINQLKQDENTDYMEWRNSIFNGYLNGEIPDIIPIENDIVYQKLMDKGAFANLYEFLDNDIDINRDSLFNCVKEPFERNGNLYQFFISFNIQTLTAKTENVKNIKKWDINTAINFIENLPEDVSFTEYDTLDMMMNIFLTKGFDSFIDYKNATCNFDTDDIHKVLNLLKKYGVSDNQKIINETMVSSTSLRIFSSYLQLKAKFDFEDITFIGYPSSNGNGSVVTGTSYAISAKSQHKEGAWEFLKYIMRDDIQNAAEPFIRPAFPSTLSAFYKIAEKEMNYIYSFNNGTSYSSKENYDNDIKLNESIDRMALTQEDIDFLVKFFNSDFPVFRYDSSLVDIIYEEIMPFIEGTKSLEETVKIIQSRALVYMNENYS